MTTSARYLECAKLEEVADQLRREGYDVAVEPSGPDLGYDLVATKPGKRIAVEVKADSALKASAEKIKELRRKAFEEGFNEFRLVVASPPHETAIQIEKLEQRLAAYLETNLPNELKAVGQPRVLHISGIEIDSIAISPEGIRVAGRGVVSIEIPFDSGPGDADVPVDESKAPGYATGSPVLDEEGIGWVAWEVDLPFFFDVDLNRELEVVRANAINVDTRSLFD